MTTPDLTTPPPAFHTPNGPTMDFRGEPSPVSFWPADAQGRAIVRAWTPGDVLRPLRCAGSTQVRTHTLYSDGREVFTINGARVQRKVFTEQDPTLTDGRRQMLTRNLIAANILAARRGQPLVEAMTCIEANAPDRGCGVWGVGEVPYAIVPAHPDTPRSPLSDPDVPTACSPEEFSARQVEAENRHRIAHRKHQHVAEARSRWQSSSA